MNSASALDPAAVISQQGALHQNQRVIIIYSSSSAAPRPTLSNCNPPPLTDNPLCPRAAPFTCNWSRAFISADSFTGPTPPPPPPPVHSAPSPLALCQRASSAEWRGERMQPKEQKGEQEEVCECCLWIVERGPIQHGSCPEKNTHSIVWRNIFSLNKCLRCPTSLCLLWLWRQGLQRRTDVATRSQWTRRGSEFRKWQVKLIWALALLCLTFNSLTTRSSERLFLHWDKV